MLKLRRMFALYAVAMCPTVCLSVHHAPVLSKALNLSSNLFFHLTIQGGPN